MTARKLTTEEQLDELMEACMQDLLALSPTEAANEFGPAQEDAAAFDAILEKASQEAGQSRLAVAKATIATRRQTALPVGIDIAMARRVVQQAANDPRITLAARDLHELSDEEIIRIFCQIEDLRKNGEDANN
jgi:hypothetical protein